MVHHDIVAGTGLYLSVKLILLLTDGLIICKLAVFRLQGKISIFKLFGVGYYLL